MSIRVMSAVWEHSKQAEGALLVLLAIADFADDQGRAYPSVARLAEKARLSERQVQRVLRQLRVSGELVIEPSPGGHKANVYWVMLMRGDKMSPQPKPEPGRRKRSDKMSPPQSQNGLPGRQDVTSNTVNRAGVTFEASRGDTGDTPGVTFATSRGDMDVTLTVIEPSLEPSEEPSRACAREISPAADFSFPKEHERPRCELCHQTYNLASLHARRCPVLEAERAAAGAAEELEAANT